MAENVGAIYYEVDAQTDGLVNSEKTLQQSAKKTQKELGKTEAKAKKLNTQMTKTAKGTKAATGAIGVLGRKAGQTGIQIQQLVGQIQGGQNATQAFAAQGADLGIVLGAPLAGVIFALSAAIGGTLASAFGTAEASIDELAEAMDELDKIMAKTDDGSLQLTEAIRDLAGASRAAAEIQIAKAIIDADNAFELATNSAKGLIDELSRYDDFASKVGKAAEQMEALNKAGEDLNVAIDVIGIGSKQTDALAISVGNLEQQFGLTRIQALDLVRAMGEFNNEASAKTATELQDTLALISWQSGHTNEEFVKLSASISEYVTVAVAAGNKSEKLKSSLENMDQAIEESAETTSKAVSEVERLRQALQLQIAIYGKTKREQALITAQAQLGTEAWADHGEEITGLINKYYDLQGARNAMVDARQTGAIFDFAQGAEGEKDTSKQFGQLSKQATEANMTPLELVNEREKLAKEELDDLYFSATATFEEYQATLTAIEEKAARDRQAIQDRENAQRQANMSLALGSASNLFDGLAQLTAEFGDEQSGVYKAMFALSKGFAIAQAGLNLSLAISNAMASLPYPANLEAMAQVAAAGGSLASSIAGATYGGNRQYGGNVESGKTYQVNEGMGTEGMMQSIGGRQYLTPLGNGKIIPANKMAGAMGSGGMTVNIDNTVPGLDFQQTQTSDTAVMIRIAKREANAVKQDMTRQMSTNQGAFYKASVKGTNIKGRATR